MNNLTLALALLPVLGCDVSTHCDPGQIYAGFACYDVPDAGAGGADAGAVSDGALDDSSNTCAPQQGFGASCTTLSQCTCGLDQCNTFMSANYCTHTHCLADPSICPTGWTCFDVTAFDPATGSLCMRP